MDRHSDTHTHNFHIPSLHTHKLNTQLWTHTTLSHTIFHIQYFNLLSHNLSTHNFVTYHVTYHLSHTNLSHTISHIQFAWQAWHSWHWVPFAWQAWHLVTSTFVSRGRRGTNSTSRRSTNSHPPSFCVAGVALMALGGALRSGLGAPWSRVTPRHCAWQVAGVALGDIHFHFTWQAWHNLTSTSVLRGRRGTISHPPSFRVAGVAQSHIHHRFVWQAWHSWHWVARLGPV